MKHPALAAFPLLFLLFLQPSSAGTSLSLEERIQAQRVIDRLRFRHQVGATNSFDEAVPHSISEGKVLASLKESVALETYWGTPITEAALRQEMERIEARTLDPARLRELYAALGNDEQLILEIVARPSLVERLMRNFYAYDERIHAEARREARELEAGLRSGAIDPRSQSPWRSVVTLNSNEDSSAESISSPAPESPSKVSELRAPEGDVFASAHFQKLQPGTISPLEEKRDSFVMQTVLPSESGSTRVVSYTVSKRSWESWWREVEGRFPLSEAKTVAGRSSPVRKLTEEAGSVSHWQPKGALAACRPDDTWDTTPFDSLPKALAGHKAFWTGNEMLVWGDKRTGGFRYNPLTDTWRTMSTVGAPEPYSDPRAVAPWAGDELMTTAVWTGREMIYWDGFHVRGGRYDPQTDSWKPISSAGAPSWRTAYATVWTGTEMIVWGGRGPATRLNDGARYNPDTDSWRPVSKTTAPAPRSNPAAFWTGEKMIVWGGFPSPQADGGALYDPVNDSWSAMSTTGSLPGGSRPPAVWAGDQMIVVSDSCSTGSRRYKPQTNTWHSVASSRNNNWACVRSGSTSRAWAGDRLILYDELNGRGASYDPVSDLWTPISVTNAPSERHDPSVVWTGEVLIYWGGDAGSSGGRYDPVSDSWTPTATAAGPEERHSHQALWTGNEMIVWGGQSGAFRNISGGGRYDGLTGQWRDLPREGAPVSGSILWTGEELLAWGGPEIGGGLFNPITDSWRPMSRTNAPPQEVTVMTWIGNKAILWGGFNEDDPDHFSPVYSNKGGIYDPASDTWTPTSTTNTPSDRANYSAVWTGEELILWGGDRCFDGGCHSNRGGGRYDPFTDTWTPMSHVDGYLAGAVWTGRYAYFVWPSRERRYDPSDDSWITVSSTPLRWGIPIQWTGEEILAAGSPGGVRYSPATDTWSRLSTENDPYPRFGESSVWTGNAMIVWGGGIDAPERTLTKSGAVYYPGVDLDRDGSTACQGDCNDADAGISPQSREMPGDLIDENCDGILACPPPTSPRNTSQFLKCVAAECGRIVRRDGSSSQECVNRVAQAMKARQCGDDRRSRSEVCDGSDLAGMTCEMQGLPGGTLACNDSCDGYDTSGCASLCGDGLVSGPEKCDGANLYGESCVSQGFDDGVLSCTESCRNLDSMLCTTSCGDGLVRGYEVCDGEEFKGKTCESLGFDGGSLSCMDACGRIDLSSCTTVCGDGVRRGTEVCDGVSGLDGLSCRTLAPPLYEGGVLGCAANCSGYDFTNCDWCGDGRRTGAEECDATDLGGETCESLGYIGGTLSCNSNCGYMGCFAN